MNFKTADLAKIEIFAPGTAGERAIRVEKKDGEVVIIDEKDAETISISGPPRDQSSLHIVKFDEDYDAMVDIYYNAYGEYKEVNFSCESVGEGIDAAIFYLKMRGLPHPVKEELEIEHEHPNFYSVDWDSTDN